jgi:glucose-6-phosphate isomerase
MAVPISFDMTYLAPEATPEEISTWQEVVRFHHDRLHAGSGPGAEFLGWMEPEQLAPAAEVDRILETAARLREESDALVLIGIGGSYLGARTVIEAIGTEGARRVVYAGHQISARAYRDLLGSLEGKRVALNVVSKSGTTTEPAIGFRVLWDFLRRTVGREQATRSVVLTTDAAKGALRKVADEEGFASFVVPDNVGGRYSVLSAVGLLPIAYAGIDVRALLAAAAECAHACEDPALDANPAYCYAVARHLLYQKGKQIEVLASFEPRLHSLAEWWKQLFGESQGKEGVSLFPAAMDDTTDLHSMGQWMQQGRRNVIETFVHIEGGEPEMIIPEGAASADGLDYLQGRPISDVSGEAYRATALAHREGGVPNATIRLPQLDAHTLGALLFFFEKACGMSGYLLGVNPFNQPGVEAYKQHMFALLGRPGYEKQSKELQSHLHEARAQIVSFR